MRKCLLAVCLIAPFATSASAAVVPCVNGGTLESYAALSPDGCSVGDLVFGSFGYSTTAALPTAADVKVWTVDDGDNTGLKFQAAWGAAAGSILDAGIWFVIRGLDITAESLGMTGFATSGDGQVRVTESLCVGAVYGSDGSCGGTTQTLEVFSTSAGTKGFDTTTFASANVVSVVKNIHVVGGASAGSDAGVSFVINTVPGGGAGGPGGGEVPEPAVVFSFGSGLLAISALMRRRLRRS